MIYIKKLINHNIGIILILIIYISYLFKYDSSYYILNSNINAKTIY